MRRVAGAGGAIVQGLGVAAGALHQVGQRLVRGFTADHDRQRRPHRHHDGYEIPERIVGKRLLQRRQQAVGGGVDVQQRVAIRRGALDAFGRQNAAGAALVLDDQCLSQIIAHPVSHEARRRIGDAAGRGRNDHLDRPIRIGIGGLRKCGACQHRDNDDRGCPNDACSHVASPLRLFLLLMPGGATRRQSAPNPRVANIAALRRG